jgi:hypothetical protein
MLSLLTHYLDVLTVTTEVLDFETDYITIREYSLHDTGGFLATQSNHLGNFYRQKYYRG